MADKYLFLVRSQPFPGSDAEFHRWYDEHHVPDLLKIPGIIAASRYSVLNGAGDWADTSLGLYEIETDDIDAVWAEMAKRYGTDQMPRSAALDSSKTLHVIAKQIRPRICEGSEK